MEVCCLVPLNNSNFIFIQVELFGTKCYKTSKTLCCWRSDAVLFEARTSIIDLLEESTGSMGLLLLEAQLAISFPNPLTVWSGNIIRAGETHLICADGKRFGGTIVKVWMKKALQLLDRSTLSEPAHYICNDFMHCLCFHREHWSPLWSANISSKMDFGRFSSQTSQSLKYDHLRRTCSWPSD